MPATLPGTRTRPNSAEDELLFIVIQQSNELGSKLIIHRLSSAIELIATGSTPDAGGSSGGDSCARRWTKHSSGELWEVRTRVGSQTP